MALPAALAVAADPIASLIDTAFIGHIGMVFVFYRSISDLVINELAFLGVQTILFCVQDRWSSLQQVSRSSCSIKLRGLPFFHWSALQPPLLREEDTVANMKLKATQVENLEDESLDNLEKGAAKKEIEDLDKNSSAKTCEMQGLTGDDKLENAKLAQLHRLVRAWLERVNPIQKRRKMLPKTVTQKIQKQRIVVVCLLLHFLPHPLTDIVVYKRQRISCHLLFWERKEKISQKICVFF